MAFINKTDPVVLNIMLTSKGRELLSTGDLTFKYFAIGDSEIDYNFMRDINAEIEPDFHSFNSNVLKPTDKNPKIISFVSRTVTGDTYNALSTISPLSYDVVNTSQELGFFTNSGTTFITDSNHVKQPDVMIDMLNISGGTSLDLKRAPTYGTSTAEPSIGDYLLVKWSGEYNTTGHTFNPNIATPHLTYKIMGVTGSLISDTMRVTVDRELPNFSGYALTNKVGAMVFHSGASINNVFSSDYIEESVLTFLQNYQSGVEVFPYWNMSIVFTEEIAGIQSNNRKYGQLKTRGYGGFVSYIQNQSPIYKKLGIIHYSNTSPANVYAEELHFKTPVLELPTIMWHKSKTRRIGLTLKPIGSSKNLSGETKSLNITYYDLADESGNIVGKVFNGLKLFVIEDQELLFAMSYKSNRSWTLPNYLLGTAGSNPCPPPTIPIVGEITGGTSTL